MAELLRFNLKKKTGLFFNEKLKSLKKFYLENNKKNADKRQNTEFKGYKWYLKKINKNKKSHVQISKGLRSLDIPIFLGKKYNYWERFIFQEEKIQNVINHYKTIWPSEKKKVPFHGDLTLDNIIFSGKKIYFIDWENFKENEDWGLDLAYFYISLVVLPALSQKKKINERDIYLFKNFWNNTFENKKYNYLKDPIEYIINLNNKKNFFSKINIILKNQIYNAIT